MKLGVLVPQLRDNHRAALETAKRAEDCGLDGVFVFDHLWPPGSPSGNALSTFPLLGAIAGATRSVTVGTLVARVGIVHNDALTNEFRSVIDIAGSRLLAGLGTGDRMNRPEDDEYGVPHLTFDRRVELLNEACEQLVSEGVRVWLAGSSEAVRTAAELHGVPVHLWQPGEERLAVGGLRPFTWGGFVEGSADEIAVQLNHPLRAGASWSVCATKGGTDTPGFIEKLMLAKARLG